MEPKRLSSKSRRIERPIDITDPRAIRGRRVWPWLAGMVTAVVVVAVVASSPEEKRVDLMRITRRANWRTDVGPKIDVDEWLFYVAQHREFDKTRPGSFQIPGMGTVHVDIEGFVIWTKYSKGRSVSFNFDGADIFVTDVDAEIQRKMCEVARTLAAHVSDETGRQVSCVPR